MTSPQQEKDKFNSRIAEVDAAIAASMRAMREKFTFESPEHIEQAAQALYDHIMSFRLTEVAMTAAQLGADATERMATRDS